MACTGGQALDLLLSAEGSYVRDIVTDELAKGLDAAWRLSADNAIQTARLRLTSLLQVSRNSWLLTPICFTVRNNIMILHK